MKRSDKIGIALFIIGLLFTVYLRILDSYRPSLTFFTDPVRATLIDFSSDEKDLFDIKYKNVPINEDLHTLYAYLYNNGSQKITSDQVREPIQLHIDGKSSIVTFKTVRKTHPNTGIELSLYDVNTLQVNFTELYNSDGVCIQIVYQGNIETDVEVTQNIAGVDQIDKLPLSQPTFYTYVTVLFLVIFGFYFMMEVIKSRNRSEIDQERMRVWLKEKKRNKIIKNAKKELNQKDDHFARIMNVVAPLMFVGLVALFYFLSAFFMKSIIMDNLKWFVPNEILIDNKIL